MNTPVILKVKPQHLQSMQEYAEQLRNLLVQLYPAHAATPTPLILLE